MQCSTIRVRILHRIISGVVVQIAICGTNPLFRPFLGHSWFFFLWNFLSSTYIFGKSGCFHPDFTSFPFKKQLFGLFFLCFFLLSYKSVFVGGIFALFKMRFYSAYIIHFIFFLFFEKSKLLLKQERDKIK